MRKIVIKASIKSFLTANAHISDPINSTINIVKYIQEKSDRAQLYKLLPHAIEMFHLLNSSVRAETNQILR